MDILNAEHSDSETIFALYEAAIEFQKTISDKHWLGFNTELIEAEIAEGRL